jgi:hypothetical protein
VATSAEALNQLLSSLVEAGMSRARFDGITLDDLAPGASLPVLDLGPETPLLITVDAARNSLGRTVPPSLSLVDDPTTTDVLELELRALLTVRGILKRGQIVEDDRALCNCMIATAELAAEPCLLYQTDVDFGLRIDARLDGGDGENPPALRCEVVEVAQLQSPLEPDDLESTHPQPVLETTHDLQPAMQVVESSTTSPVFERLRALLNEAIPPLVVPPEVLTLGGWLGLSNLRLFAASATKGAGGLGYLGILADLGDEQPPSQHGAGVLLAERFVPPQIIRTGMPTESSWSLTICDAAGRTVRRLQGEGGPGFVEIEWDGRSDAGRRVATGDYVYHFTAAGFAESRKISLNE